MTLCFNLTSITYMCRFKFIFLKTDSHYWFLSKRNLIMIQFFFLYITKRRQVLRCLIFLVWSAVNNWISFTGYCQLFLPCQFISKTETNPQWATYKIMRTQNEPDIHLMQAALGIPTVNIHWLSANLWESLIRLWHNVHSTSLPLCLLNRVIYCSFGHVLLSLDCVGCI